MRRARGARRPRLRSHGLDARPDGALVGGHRGGRPRRARRAEWLAAHAALSHCSARRLRRADMTFHVHLAGVVGAGAAACGAAAWAAARRFGPRSLVAISLSQATAVGVAVALAATDTLAASSTSLMGKASG